MLDSEIFMTVAHLDSYSLGNKSAFKVN